MKNHKLFRFVIILIALSSAGWTNNVDASRRLENDSVLTFKVSSDKQTYILGEEVKLTFKVTNESDKPVLLYSPTVYNGYMKVWISTDGEEYKRYSGNSDWGLDDRVGGTTLQAGKAYEHPATVLWNLKPDSFLPQVAIERINSHYAFPTKGIYFIKAILYFPEIANRQKIESQPIQIVVEEPVGEDLEVWNSIKDNGEISHFLHNGYFLTYKDEEREKLAEKVKQIIQRYPRSFLVSQLQKSWEKFKVYEEKRKEFLEKARSKKMSQK